MSANKNKITDDVKVFYSSAAINPQEGLCCPIQPNKADTTHIPEAVLGISYGCGSPVGEADLKPGEVVLDLGSGGGIDCFIADKKVGPKGSVIGIDMTDEMLEVAAKANPKVSENLGFDVVKFKKGLLEDIPQDDNSVDVIMSNCVINLSHDKLKTLKESYRILKDFGRLCISDVVSEVEVPKKMQDDKKLWGECISGALKEDDFYGLAMEAGFVGITVGSRYLYRIVEGIRFYSVTIRAYKVDALTDNVEEGLYAIYEGPFKEVTLIDGLIFKPGVLKKISAKTADLFNCLEFGGDFSIIEVAKDGKATVHSAKPLGSGSAGCC